MMNILLIIVIVDLVSVINIINVCNIEGVSYYLLFQSIISIFIWWFLIIDYLEAVGLLYYSKLGAGICGYYIPNLYYNIFHTNFQLIIYIGCTNILLMYNVINLFTNNDLFCFTNLCLFIFILIHWIYNGYINLNSWLYCISFSTIILSNIYYIFSCNWFCLFDPFNVQDRLQALFYIVFYFTLSSISIFLGLCLLIFIYYNHTY